MEDNVGTIVIGTKVDTKGATKEIEQLYQKIDRNQSKIERLTERRQTLDINAEKFERKIEQAGKKTDKLASKLEEIARFQLEDVENLPATTENMQMMHKKLSNYDITDYGQKDYWTTYTRAESYQKINEQFSRYVNQIEDANNQLNLTIDKQQRISQEIAKTETEQIKLNEKLSEASGSKGFNTKDFEKGINKIEKGFNGLVKKAFRLGLALIGIRTVINLITRSFNVLSQYNEELGTKVEQMRLALAVALEPIINWILTLLQQVLSAINQILNALFSIDIFGRAQELWSKRMAKNMASGAGSAKEMKKQLAGFDEMNVLQDNDASSGGGAGGTGIEPWMLEETEVPWMAWLLKYKNEILGALAGIASALLLIKLGMKGIKALGIGVIIAGLLMLIQDFKAYLDDPSWENFGKIWRDIGIILIGVGIVIGGIPGIVIAVIGAIIAGIGLLIEHWDKVKAWLQGIGKWFTQKGEEFKKKGNLFLGDIFSGVSKTIDDLIYIFEWFVSTGKIIFDGIIKFVKTTFKDGWKSGLEVLKDTFKQVWDKIGEIFDKTIQRTKERFSSMWTWIKTFVVSLAITMGDMMAGAIKGAVNGALSWVESKINSFIGMVNNAIKLINKIPGVNLSRLSYISLPRLATGGIINQPGRGVPVGGAIAGEAGREGILPLTDRQAMQELGKEIGKWITIQNTTPVYIGNRQIARVINEINADREFATNGG